MDHKVEQSSGNIYADLGLPQADEMLIKAQLAMAIGNIIKELNLTQQQAAALLGMKQPRLSNLLRGQFRGISEAKMLEYLTRLGRDVQIVVGNSRRPSGTGTLKVVLA
ncbi:helix-turn-helix domain-containing protein [Dryocola clanedunensis]